MADTGLQTWHFAGISQSADGIRKVGVSVSAEQSQIKGNLATLASIWGGAGSEAYQALQMRWDGKSQTVNEALNNLANAIDQAQADMS
ncbi:WXG100 family type VII secretion target, partial [Mycobacteroides abscessus]